MQYSAVSLNKTHWSRTLTLLSRVRTLAQMRSFQHLISFARRDVTASEGCMRMSWTHFLKEDCFAQKQVHHFPCPHSSLIVSTVTNNTRPTTIRNGSDGLTLGSCPQDASIPNALFTSLEVHRQHLVGRMCYSKWLLVVPWGKCGRVLS